MESILSLRTALYFAQPMDLDSTDSVFSNSNVAAKATDAEVWQALKAGQSQALRIIYERYASLVYRLALRILTNAQEAEDLTQEIFLNLWRNRGYDPLRGSLSSYLTTL